MTEFVVGGGDSDCAGLDGVFAGVDRGEAEVERTACRRRLDLYH